MFAFPVRTWILFDIETVDAKECDGVPSMIEIGGIKLDGDLTVLDRLSFLVKPPNLNEVSDDTYDLTGISALSLENELPWLRCWKRWAEFTEYNNLPLASWGSYVDGPILREAYRRNNLGFPHKPYILDVGSMVWAICGLYGMRFPFYGLRSIAKSFEIELPEYHRALADCDLMLRVLQYLQAM